MLLIYDVGYGRFKNVGDLIKLLKERDVQVLVDIRAFPRSKIPGFNRENLCRCLRDNGLDYVWLGDKLGGYRKGGYEKFMESEIFKDGLEELIQLAMRRTVCIMCLEKKRSGCHRRFIVTKLKERGFEVKDLVEGA